MRVILDTNVLMSAIFFGGIPGEILAATKTGRISLVLSPAILEEYHEVAKRLSLRFHVEYADILEWITVRSEMIADTSMETPICNDPDDEKFIAAALASKTKIICSGDKHLLDINGHEGLVVLKPKPFSDQYLKTK